MVSVEERAPARGVRGRLLDLMFVRGRVEDVSPGPGRMRWIEVTGVPGLDWTPGQPDEPVHGVIEVARPEDRLPLPRTDDLTWCHRGDAPAANSATLVEAVRGLDLPSEPGFAYVAGEARTVQAVRAHLVRERGWPRRSVLVKPFWTPGKRGME
jgi:hypothetical protein